MTLPTCINLSDTDILAGIANSHRLAVDTEFMRERTFVSQLCLVQIATGNEVFCLDPLTDGIDPNNHQAWSNLLQNSWVLHSGRQDIEVVFQTTGSMPAAVLDTQIAAGLLGMSPQLGYANLVSELFDVQLAKSHTRADWSKRPLTEGLLQYASEDVEYLLPAYDELRARLEKLGRWEWAEKDSTDLLNLSLYEIDPMSAINRLKGARNLRGASRNVATRLAAWREREAQRHNRPRQWIVRDGVLIDIAQQQPSTEQQLIDIPDISERMVKRSSDALLQAIQEGKNTIDDYQPPLRPSEAQKALLKQLQLHVTKVASELNIASELLAPKRELSAAVIEGNTDGRVFTGWRAALAGDDLRSML